MKNELIENTIVKLIADMKQRYPDFKGIYLFGSYARGDFKEDSDYDMALIFERSIDRKFKDSIRLRIMDYEIENQIIIDSHIYNYNDIQNPITPFREKVKSEGIYYVS